MGTPSQQSQVYAAESECYAKFAFDDLTFDEVELYVRTIVTDDYVVNLFGQIDPKVEMGRDRGPALGSATRLVMPPWAWVLPIVLHEVAHALAEKWSGTRDHGWQFCHVYLELVYRYLGEMIGDSLREAFASHGVEYVSKAHS